MFTGIVEGALPLRELERGDGARLAVDLGNLAQGVAIGDSIAIDGCCLTVTRLDGSLARFDAVPETLDRTTLGRLRVGDHVNVERSLRLGDRLGGHLVTGHIDGIGPIQRFEPQGSEWVLEVEVPPPLRRYFIEKGSVAIDGISLTVAEVRPTGFRVAVIPHTLEVTNLGGRKVGDVVNLETDVLGKWVARMLAEGRIEGSLSVEDLAKAGFIDPNI